MFIGTTQSGLLVIANAAPIGAKILGPSAWLLVSWGGLINAMGRVGTGMYSDKIGRDNAYTINCLVSAGALLLLSTIIASGNLFLLFLAVGHRLLAVWRWFVPDARLHGGLLRPQKPGHELWPGVPRLGSGLLHDPVGRYIKDITGTLTWAFILSAIVLIIAVVISRVTKRPMHSTE